MTNQVTNKLKTTYSFPVLFLEGMKCCVFPIKSLPACVFFSSFIHHHMERNTHDKQQTDVSLSSRRIVLLGKSGAGISAAGNTKLGQKVFRSEMRMIAVTSVCSEARTTVSGRSVSVVDTPGFFDTEMKHKELITEIARSIYLSSPGPHAFLTVFNVNMRFTEQEQ